MKWQGSTPKGDVRRHNFRWVVIQRDPRRAPCADLRAVIGESARIIRFNHRERRSDRTAASQALRGAA